MYHLSSLCSQLNYYLKKFNEYKQISKIYKKEEPDLL